MKLGANAPNEIEVLLQTTYEEPINFSYENWCLIGDQNGTQ